MQLSLDNIKSILYNNAPLQFDEETLQGVVNCYNFLSDFAQNKVIYGINTGFGPMAQWRVAGWYWSSSEENDENAWNIKDSGNIGTEEKDKKLNVRAVRAF